MFLLQVPVPLRRNKPSKTLLAMGVSENLAERAIRISLSFDNTIEEAMKFIAAVKQTAKSIRKGNEIK